MQNKGAIRAIAIIFALIFLYQLSFTVVTKIVERRAEKNATEQVFPKDANGQDIAVSESIQDAIAETTTCQIGTPNGILTIMAMGEVNGIIESQTANELSGLLTI